MIDDPTKAACGELWIRTDDGRDVVIFTDTEGNDRTIDEILAENARLRDALGRIDDASNHYAMTSTYSEGTLRYAHESTRNLARAALGTQKDNGK